MDRDGLEELRRDFAHSISTAAAVRDPRIEAAFAATPREDFAGPGPWWIAYGFGYDQTPGDDPRALYKDCLVAIDAARGVNIGQPSLHAMCLDALALRAGETVVHVGAGVGYYTAIIARLVGPGGKVVAYEIEPAYANRARKNLAGFANVVVEARSGISSGLPQADVVYVNAAAVEPYRAWREALRPGGRLMFPLQAPGGTGAMLLITRPASGYVWTARTLSLVSFVACEGVHDDAGAQRLLTAFQRSGPECVRSLRTGPPDDTCWLAGNDWWLSTARPD